MCASHRMSVTEEDEEEESHAEEHSEVYPSMQDGEGHGCDQSSGQPGVFFHTSSYATTRIITRQLSHCVLMLTLHRLQHVTQLAVAPLTYNYNTGVNTAFTWPTHLQLVLNVLPVIKQNNVDVAGLVRPHAT